MIKDLIFSIKKDVLTHRIFNVSFDCVKSIFGSNEFDSSSFRIEMFASDLIFSRINFDDTVS